MAVAVAGLDHLLLVHPRPREHVARPGDWPAARPQVRQDSEQGLLEFLVRLQAVGIEQRVEKIAKAVRVSREHARPLVVRVVAMRPPPGRTEFGLPLERGHLGQHAHAAQRRGLVARIARPLVAGDKHARDVTHARQIDLPVRMALRRGCRQSPTHAAGVVFFGDRDEPVERATPVFLVGRVHGGKLQK